MNRANQRRSPGCTPCHDRKDLANFLRRTLAALALFGLTCISGSVEATTLSSKEFKEAYERAFELEEASPHEAFDAMLKLAKGGHSKAQDRIGYYYRNGIGRDVDLTAARDWYQRAVDNGRAYSLTSLARIEISLGNEDAAFDLLNEAVELNMPGAQRLLAFSHIDRKLGDRSDPEVGLETLMPMVLSRDEKAAIPLLLRYNWRRLPDPAPEALIELVEDIALAGDPKAAEAALWYLTRVEPDKVARRSALFAVPNQRPSRHRSEEIELARDLVPSHFWLEAERVLSEAEPEAFQRAAITTFRINKNAFIRVVQKELSSLGYTAGRPDGIAGSRTISAINRFCRDHGISEACAHGPAKSITARALAAQLALLRSNQNDFGG